MSINNMQVEHVSLAICERLILCFSAKVDLGTVKRSLTSLAR